MKGPSEPALRSSLITWVLAVAGAIGVGLWFATFLPVADPLPSPLQGWRTVGSYFDHPAGWPGKPWSKDGRTVAWSELEASGGPAHCGWDTITMLNIGWPLGTSSISSAEDRQYLRDPSHAITTPWLLGSWAKNPKLPSDAGDTGYRYGAVKLYLAPSDQDAYAYLLAPADSERWPRSDPPTTCA